MNPYNTGEEKENLKKAFDRWQKVIPPSKKQYWYKRILDKRTLDERLILIDQCIEYFTKEKEE